MPDCRSPEELESKYVHEVYKNIAPGFKNNHYKAWPFVEHFLKRQPIGSIIADVGCGSGKYLGLTTNSFMMGSDSCEKLVEIACERKHEAAVCNNLKLPYKDGCFDAVISIGVIHHLASTKRRISALQELGRILRPGGQMLVYVWAMEQNERKFDAQDVLVPYTGNKRKGKNRQPVQQQSLESYPMSSYKISTKLQRSRSFDSLYDNYLPSDIRDEEINKQNRDDIVPTSIEFRALKEIVETIKHKKDQLIKNINLRVMKLYPDKEKQFVNELVSAVVGKIFDRNVNRNEKITIEDSQKRLPSITEFVSSLVKRIFKDKTDETSQGDYTEWFLEDSATNDVLQKENEEAFKQGLYESLFSWAKEKMALISFEQQRLHYGMTREDSCDSEYSEPDTNSPYLLADINKCKQAKDKTMMVKNQQHLLSIALSFDNDSDSSSSTDFFNSDSSISDNDAPANSKQSTFPSTSVKTTTAKKTTLQRYYHVFSAKELPDLIEGSVHGVNVLKEYYDHGNWAVIAEKL